MLCINVADARVRVRIERRLATQALSMQQEQGTRAESGLKKSTQHKVGASSQLLYAPADTQYSTPHTFLTGSGGGGSTSDPCT